MVFTKEILIETITEIGITIINKVEQSWHPFSSLGEELNLKLEDSRSGKFFSVTWTQFLPAPLYNSQVAASISNNWEPIKWLIEMKLIGCQRIYKSIHPMFKETMYMAGSFPFYILIAHYPTPWFWKVEQPLEKGTSRNPDIHETLISQHRAGLMKNHWGVNWIVFATLLLKGAV